MSSTNSNVADELKSLAATLNSIANGLQDGTKASPEQHAILVETLKSTIAVVNEPQDDIIDLMLGFVQCTAIRLLMKWKVFEHIPASGTISYKELAAKVGGDTSLITRLCWALVAAGILKQEGSDQVAHTGRSAIYASVNPLSAMMQAGYDEYLPPLIALPAYFDTYGTKEPAGRLHCVKSFSEGKPELTFSEVMSQLPPERLRTMGLAMAAMGNMYFTSVPYDYSWVAARAGELEDRPLIVDVGAGQGQTLQAICKETPGLSMSRCVLEELPEVVERIKTSGNKDILKAQLIGMDIFKSQPVKGALVYLLRLILRDYSDDESVVILKYLSAAMAPDSKLLVEEPVIGNPPSRFPTMVDVILATIGGKERTLEGFRDITGRAGLKITAVSSTERSDMSIIVCEKA